ncbi:sce7726 family protein [Nocardioides sp. cx-173]|uniref:sce7726 family protein n=1 Tax=Nocardioides sp. cx-173 TaxID=2898796 RepID=UPI001E55EF4F|nr:sce7726 family protein [Nocardioides sp. cx-173]MCD4525243.1 sce7726 family protein [Nocardioides sp. cx-173]UGB40954.1 sce7726 family protein [Nocardioides sp. cx-173]
MRDAHVREALRGRLEAEHAADRASTLLVDELGLCGQVRVDVAVVNGALSGYELKSAQDTLKRLPAQVEVYSRVLDHATLVVAQNHVGHAQPLLPAWWGLIEARWDGEQVDLVDRLEPQPNPGIDAHSLVQLLWRDEALDELAVRGLDVGVRGKPRTAIWSRLADEVPLHELRTAVRMKLRARASWRSAR